MPKDEGSRKLSREEMLSKRRKELFGDCALIEIIHLHDCLRGALKALETDVSHLARVVREKKLKRNSLLAASTPAGETTTCESAKDNDEEELLSDLEGRVAGRFNVIWSVFRAHSSAEDEFIWPALQQKTKGRIKGSPKYNNAAADSSGQSDDNQDVIEQEEYEEDHADEERMFSEVGGLLSELRDFLGQRRTTTVAEPPQAVVEASSNIARDDVDEMAQNISERTKNLSKHLMEHLDKEETQCLPLVVNHLSKNEIHELVGKIMGKRSADTIAQIMTMAVQNLDKADRDEMVRYMKQSMAGTYFDRWLLMSGWMASTGNGGTDDARVAAATDDRKRAASHTAVGEGNKEDGKKPRASQDGNNAQTDRSATLPTVSSSTHAATGIATCQPVGERTSQAELEKLIRVVASNPSLSAAKKNATIQGLRDSVWKSNQRLRAEQPTLVNQSVPSGLPFAAQGSASMSPVLPVAATTVCSSRNRRVTAPSAYYTRSGDGKTVELNWSDSSPIPADGSVPLFSAAELAPTYHDGAAGAVLGCPHYARNCKLRHPKSGRLYTCRLCCEQERELPTREQDETLDRYEVKEVICMTCNALQPAEDRCFNSDCASRGRPFAKYFCRICHLYDDGSRPIFHCPYCNTCRLGHGLGIDFRHCMRCNACVSLADDDHRCIPQKLQGDCPICHESLFSSTEPLRGLKCGHVMHMSCFHNYRRGHSYTCPLCLRSMEDMKDYFAILDTAIRMQPMPAAYLSTMSNIYCQDCGKTGQVQYHFVGQKCPHCASYNTRELGRVHNAPTMDVHGAG